MLDRFRGIIFKLKSLCCVWSFYILLQKLLKEQKPFINGTRLIQGNQNNGSLPTHRIFFSLLLILIALQMQQKKGMHETENERA
jgi:hypothetical protein